MSEHTHTPGLSLQDQVMALEDGAEYSGKVLADAMALNAELLEALETSMQWIKAWDVAFLFDDEWPSDEAKIKAAIAHARGEG